MKKRLLHILALILSLSSLCSCVDTLPKDTPSSEQKTRLNLFFDIPGQDITKAPGETPHLQNLYVSVFETNGYKLAEYAEAYPITLATENGTRYGYTVELNVSDKPRILHFIGNAPKEIKYGSEAEVIGSLVTRAEASDSNGDYTESYWQRIRLDKIPGIPDRDDVNYDAKMAEYNAIAAQLSGITLVRNFAKVTVKSTSTSNLEISGFWFINNPDQGTVAAYNRNSGDFISAYQSKSVETLRDKDGLNYQGFEITGTKYLTPASFTDGNKITVASSTVGASGYVYEREPALSDPLYIIVEGKYNGSPTPTYYKVSMQDANGEFFPILRNFEYLVTISSVSRAGEATPDDAILSAPTGDISVNLDLQDVPNISNGISRLTVSETNVVLVAQNENSTNFVLKYRFEPDINNPGAVNNHVTTTGTPDSENPVKVSYTAGNTGRVFASDGIIGNEDGNEGTITLTTVNVSGTTKTETITITGTAGGHTITRTVNFILREKFDMKLSCAPFTDNTGKGWVEKQAGSSVVLNIGIEGGMHSSMFPLSFHIYVDALSLTIDNSHPENHITVETGVNKGKPAFYFVKTISWDEYVDAGLQDAGYFAAHKVFPVYFKTNKAESASDIHVLSDYFEDKDTSIGNFDSAEFTDLAFDPATVSMEDDVVNFTFGISSVPSDSKVYVGLIGFEPATLTAPEVQKLEYHSVENYNTKNYDVYSYSLDETEKTNKSVTLKLKPSAAGSASVYLYADRFESNSMDVEIASNRVTVQFAYDGQSTPGSHAYVTDLAHDYVGNGWPIKGQTYTVKFYLSESASAGAVIDGVYAGTTLCSEGISTKINGDTYYTYTAEITSTTSENVTVKIHLTGSDGESRIDIGELPVTVYKYRLLTAVTSFDNNTVYVIKSNSASYMYHTGSTTLACNLAESNINPEAFWSIKDNQKIFHLGHGDGNYYLTNANTPALGSSSNYTLSVANGTDLYIKNGTKYLAVETYGNNPPKLQSGTTNARWKIYPVEFSEATPTP